MVHSCVLVVFVIADNSVEVALWGGEDICVVHQKSARETVPTADTELEEWPRENDPFRPCKFRYVMLLQNAALEVLSFLL